MNRIWLVAPYLRIHDQLLRSSSLTSSAMAVLLLGSCVRLSCPRLSAILTWCYWQICQIVLRNGLALDLQVQQLDQQEEAVLTLQQEGRWLMRQLWTVAKAELVADYPGLEDVDPRPVGLELQSAPRDKKSVPLNTQVRNTMTCKQALPMTPSNACLICEMRSLTEAGLLAASSLDSCHMVQLQL